MARIMKVVLVLVLAVLAVLSAAALAVAAGAAAAVVAVAAVVVVVGGSEHVGFCTTDYDHGRFRYSCAGFCWYAPTLLCCVVLCCVSVSYLEHFPAQSPGFAAPEDTIPPRV